MNMPARLIVSTLGFVAVVTNASAKDIRPASREQVSKSEARGAAKLKQELLTLETGRMPTLAQISGHMVVLKNIIHDNTLWKATLDPSAITRIIAYTTPLPGGQFHFSGGFEFQGGVILRAMDGSGKTARVQQLVMGTGPTKSMSLGSILGVQNVSTRTKSLEQLSTEVKDLLKYSKPINQNKVAADRFFLAFAEEATRFYFLQQLRTARIDLRSSTHDHDPMDAGRYTLFGENCVSSGMRNIGHALLGKREWTWVLDPKLSGLYRDISPEAEPLAYSASQLEERIEFYASAALAVDARLAPAQAAAKRNDLASEAFVNPVATARVPEVEAAYNAVADYRKGFGGKFFSLAYPPRARELVDFVTK